MASHQNRRRQGSGGWGVASPASLQGYHTPARGQSRTADAPVPPRAAPGLARGRAASDRRDATRPPACEIGTRAVAGPSNVEKYRETRRSTESVPPGQLHRVRLLAQVAKRGADELAGKPDTDQQRRGWST
jgi:hypothetical protein